MLSAYQLTAEEQKAIIAGFDDPSGLQAGGVRANGKKFFTLGVTPRTIYGKQGVSIPALSLTFSRLGASHRSYSFADVVSNYLPIGGNQGDGLVAVKTNQAVLVCVYMAPIVPGEANKVAEGLGDYLVSVGY